jgi:hypothetical protein
VLTRLWRASVVLCCILGLAERSSAQRVTPSRFAARSVDAGQKAVSGRSGDWRAQSDSTLIVPIALVRSAESDRGAHAGYGALVGALIGGTLGFLVDREDHTGEGFIAPVMIGGGAALGAVVGALVGLVMPAYHATGT